MAAAPILALLPATAGASASGAGSSGTNAPGPAFVQVGHVAVLPRGARVVGALAARQPLTVDVVLAPRDAAALARDAAAVASPSSPMYRHFFSAGAVGQLFAPPPSTVALVEAELRSEGLTVAASADAGLVLHVSADAAQMESAFRTSLDAVRLPDGSSGRIATSAPEVPSAISGAVASVIGLNVLAKPEPIGALRDRRASASRAGSPAGARPAVPAQGPQVCAGELKAAEEFAGYTPDQVASAYGLDGLYKTGDLGGGTKVDIFELEPFDMTDLDTFTSCLYGPKFVPDVTVQAVDGGEPPGYGSGEAALDVEEITALAPDADVTVYEAPQTFTSWLDEIAAIVAHPVPVVSTSWGTCEAYLEDAEPGFEQVENVLFEQAALEGESWFAASGDTGSEECYDVLGQTTPAAADPAGQPFVTGVGGTTILAPTQPPDEVVWNDGGGYGASGGGISNLWSMPAWQSGLDVPGVENSYSSGTPCGAPAGVTCRETPDVSANADEFHGDTIYYGGGWTTIGGTSAAAPKWAAITALASSDCRSGIGFAAPALYQIASDPTTYAEAFNDITRGNNDVLDDNDGSYPATVGYDMATGLGTPRVTDLNGSPGLASLLCADGLGLGSRPVLSSIAPDYGIYTGGTAVTITGENLTGVTAIDFGAAVVPVTAQDITGGDEIKVTTPPSPTSPAIEDAAVGGVVVIAAGSGGSSLPNPLVEFHFVDETPSHTAVPSVSFIGPSAGPSGGGNTVTIIGSGFQEGPYAGGGTKPAVAFGDAAVPSSDVTVLSDSEISVVVPADPNDTSCVTEPTVPLSNICQAQVTVANSNGTSATAPIYPEVNDGTPVTQASEQVAAPTEYDYAPAPTTTSISPTELGEFPNLEEGAAAVTINGTGFNFLTFVGVTFGEVGQPWASQGFGLEALLPDQVVEIYFGLSEDVPLTSFPVTVQTEGGTSNPQTVEVPPVPEVTSINVHSGPTTGGTSITATGSGFGAGDTAEFISGSGVDLPAPTASNLTPNLAGTSVTFVTPAALASPGEWAICSASGCSFGDSGGFAEDSDVAFTYYEPIAPTVSGITPTSGPAGGGKFVTLTGSGLGNVVSVDFGRVASPVVANPPLPFDLGTTDARAVAEIPPGTAGATVGITLRTLAGSVTVPDAFTYVKSAPATPASITAVAGGGEITVSWKASAGDGGSPLEGYIVSALPLTGSGASVEVGPSVLRTVLQPLTPNVSYDVTVEAVSAFGKSQAVGELVGPVRFGSNGYIVAGAGGRAVGFGSLGGAPSGVSISSLPGPIVGLAGTGEGLGYWLAGADGSVYALGTAHNYGSLPTTLAHRPIVGIAAAPLARGYWLAGSDGGIYAFGSAKYFGSLAGKHLNKPIVGLAATPTGLGYWLVAADGGVFALGDAKYHGGLGAIHLDKPIVAMIVTSDGLGYWLVAADGGVFAFGDAKYHGGLGGKSISAPIVGAVGTPDGLGYWLLGRDGKTYPFGDAKQEGSAAGLLGGDAGGIGL